MFRRLAMNPDSDICTGFASLQPPATSRGQGHYPARVLMLNRAEQCRAPPLGATDPAPRNIIPFPLALRPRPSSKLDADQEDGEILAYKRGRLAQ